MIYLTFLSWSCEKADADRHDHCHRRQYDGEMQEVNVFINRGPFVWVTASARRARVIDSHGVATNSGREPRHQTPPRALVNKGQVTEETLLHSPCQLTVFCMALFLLPHCIARQIASQLKIVTPSSLYKYIVTVNECMCEDQITCSVHLFQKAPKTNTTTHAGVTVDEMD